MYQVVRKIDRDEIGLNRLDGSGKWEADIPKRWVLAWSTVIVGCPCSHRRGTMVDRLWPEVRASHGILANFSSQFSVV